MYAALYEQVNPLSKSTAMQEILLLLAVSFVLGFLAHWLWCRYKHNKRIVQRPAATPLAARQPVSTPLTQPAKKDDLKIVEGIGPKIEELLHESGISTYSDLANSNSQALDRILQQAGNRFGMHSTDTWPRQAALARDGRWKELEQLKERLVAGR